MPLTHFMRQQNAIFAGNYSVTLPPRLFHLCLTPSAPSHTRAFLCFTNKQHVRELLAALEQQYRKLYLAQLFAWEQCQLIDLFSFSHLGSITALFPNTNIMQGNNRFCSSAKCEKQPQSKESIRSIRYRLYYAIHNYFCIIVFIF